jgi:hypothetical protein
MKDITTEVYNSLSKQIIKTNTLLKSTRDTYKPAVYPSRRTMPHDESTVLVGNALTSVVDAGQFDNRISYQNPGQDGDIFTQSVVLTAGSYTFHVLGKVDYDCAIIDWTLDEFTIGLGQDWYGATANNVEKILDIVLPIDRNFVLKGTINGRNVASNGYQMYLTKMWFKQVVD